MDHWSQDIFQKHVSVSPFIPRTLLDLPDEILTRIIFYVFVQGYPILPIVKACKSFYNSFIYIVYLTNVVHIEEFSHFVKKDKFRFNTIHILKVLNNHKEDIISRIPILKLHSNISTLWINKTDTEFLKYLPMIVPFSSNLVIFNVVLNSTVLLYKVFQILPENLKVLVLRLEMTRFQLTLAKTSSVEKDIRLISKLRKLEFFEISSHNCEIIVDHYHPELGSRVVLGIRELGTNNSDNSILSKLYNRIQSKTNETVVKRSIGKLIYKFLEMNGGNLLKVEIIGIDISLIFNKTTQKSFKLPKIRLISFDNTTNINMHKWIVEFQLMNCHSTFKNLSPILLFHDKLAGRLYLRETARIISQIDTSVTELALWRFTEKVFDGYHRVHRVRELEY